MSPEPGHPPLRAFLAARASLIDASGIRKVFDLAATLDDPIDLSIGRPYQDAPEPVKESAIRAIRRGDNAYTPTQGRSDLVDSLLERLGREVSIEDRAVLVTSGVSGGLFLAFAALIDPGDEVLMADPYFVIYHHVVRFFGGVPVPVDTYPDFRMTAERIEPHITDRSKLLIVSSPANPTGTVLDADHLAEIADLAGRRGLMVLSDEIYREFSYDGPAPSMAGLHEPTLLLAGFSKSHAVTGWRVGYAFGPAELIAEMGKLQQYSFVCAPAPFQAAMLENLDLDTTEMRSDYRRKRDLLYNGISANYDLTRPAGAFYAFPRVPRGTDVEFVEQAVRNNLLVIPGSIFSGRNTHFRISYAADDETLKRGVAVLNDLA